MNVKKIIASLVMLAWIAGAQAQKVKDKQFVDKLCGCFEVEFKYAETFSPDEEYQYHKRERIVAGAELAFPIENDKKKIVIQHLLIISDSMIVKHWREDWTYEDPVTWQFQGDNVWTKTLLAPREVKGKWSQGVWEVSDAPRYFGASNWVEQDGKIVWQNTTDAPLPRREYSKRSDYNILRRTNRLVIDGDKGYIHEQDNKKVLRKNGQDELIAEEKGINSYVRKPDSDCDAGRAYWEKTKDYWSSVRKVWDEYLATHDKVTLKNKVDGKVMHDYLFAMAKDYSTGSLKPDDTQKSLQDLLGKFVEQL